MVNKWGSVGPSAAIGSDNVLGQQTQVGKEFTTQQSVRVGHKTTIRQKAVVENGASHSGSGVRWASKPR